MLQTSTEFNEIFEKCGTICRVSDTGCGTPHCHQLIFTGRIVASSILLNSMCRIRSFSIRRRGACECEGSGDSSTKFSSLIFYLDVSRGFGALTADGWLVRRRSTLFFFLDPVMNVQVVFLHSLGLLALNKRILGPRQPLSLPRQSSQFIRLSDAPN